MEDHLRMADMGYLHEDEMKKAGKKMQKASYGGPKGEAAYLARRDAAIKKAMAEEQDGGDPNAMSPAEKQMQALVNAQQELAQQRQMIMMAYQENPEQFSSPEAQAGLEERLMILDQNLAQVQAQLQQLSEQEFLSKTTIPLSEFVGETDIAAKQNMGYDFYNPQLMMAKEGKELPTYQEGNGENSFAYEGTDDNGYPISLNALYNSLSDLPVILLGSSKSLYACIHASLTPLKLSCIIIS